MSKALITESLLTAIADAIRAKTGGTANMTPAEMVPAIGSISGGGDLPIDFLAADSSVQEITSADITTLRDYAITCSPSLETVRLPNVTEAGKYNLYECPALKTVYMPALKTTGGFFMSTHATIQSLDLSSLEEIKGYDFGGALGIASNVLTFPAVIKVGSSTSRAGYLFTGLQCEEVNFPILPAIYAGYGGLFSKQVISGGNYYPTTKRFYAPLCTTISGQASSYPAFSNDNRLARLELPALESATYLGTFSNQFLEDVDAGKLNAIDGYNRFSGFKLKNLVLRKTGAVCSLSSGSYIDSSSPIKKGSGYVYVPRALISTYQTATNWSTIYTANPNVFRAIEDYTVDGTLTGRMDWARMTT